MFATGHVGGHFESVVVPVCPGRYEAVVRDGNIVAIRTFDGKSYQDFGPGSDFWSGFVSDTNKRLFVSVCVFRIQSRFHSNGLSFGHDEVKMIGVGRFAETPEGMSNVSLLTFSIAEAMNLPGDGSGFRDIVCRRDGPQPVPMGELFLASAGPTYGDTHFLYVGEVAQKFLGKVISFSFGQWRTNPETMLRLLSRCGLTDALIGNETAMSYLTYVASQVEEELVQLEVEIGELERRLKSLTDKRQTFGDEHRIYRQFMST